MDQAETAIQAAESAPSLDALRGVLQRIRAGWLPHSVGPDKDSWWWGRPTRLDGFYLWSNGAVPSMNVVERMTEDEVAAWTWSLHPMAPEAGDQMSTDGEGQK